MFDRTRLFGWRSAVAILAAGVLAIAPLACDASPPTQSGKLIGWEGTVTTPASWEAFELEEIQIEGSGSETLTIFEVAALERERPCRYRFRGSEVPAGPYRLQLSDPPSSTEVVLAADAGSIPWTIPERVQLEVSVLSAEGEPVPGATVAWSARLEEYDPEQDEYRDYPVPDALSSRVVALESSSGRTTLTVVPWESSVAVEAPGFVSSHSQVPLGDAERVEHQVRLVRAGYLVVHLTAWEPGRVVTLLLTPVGNEGFAPDALDPDPGDTRRFALAPGRYVVGTADPEIESPVSSEPFDVRVGETTQVTLRCPGVESSPSALAETRARRLGDHVRCVLQEFRIADKVKLDRPRTLRDAQGEPTAVAMRVNFREKEGYRFDDLLRFFHWIERGAGSVRVTEMDFGRKDPGTEPIWRPLAFEVVHPLPSLADTARSPSRLPSLATVIEDYRRALEGLGEAGLVAEEGACRLTAEIGPTCRIRWWMRGLPKCDLPRVRAAFETWPGFQDMTLEEQKDESDAVSLESFVLTWSP